MARTLQPDDRIGHYRIVGPIGAGGMGEVYRAQDSKLERDVALKVLPAALVRSEERVKRFMMEARSASSLNHPNIVTIYEIGEQPVQVGAEGEKIGEPIHYIAMELIQGKTLRQLIEQKNAIRVGASSSPASVQIASPEDDDTTRGAAARRQCRPSHSRAAFCSSSSSVAVPALASLTTKEPVRSVSSWKFWSHSAARGWSVPSRP